MTRQPLPYAFRFWGFGKMYLDTYIAAKNGGKKLPCYALLAHSIELLLKGIIGLQDHASDNEYTMKRLGHDLPKILMVAKSGGLDQRLKSYERCEAILNIIGPYHLARTFHYAKPKNQLLTLPRLHELEAIAKELEAILFQLTQESSKGKELEDIFE